MNQSSPIPLWPNQVIESSGPMLTTVTPTKVRLSLPPPYERVGHFLLQYDPNKTHRSYSDCIEADRSSEIVNYLKSKGGMCVDIAFLPGFLEEAIAETHEAISGILAKDYQSKAVAAYLEEVYRRLEVHRGRVYYEKLVRDRTPELFAEEKVEFELEEVPKKELPQQLIEKVIEKAIALSEPEADVVDELADLTEAIDCLTECMDIEADVENRWSAKRGSKGRFMAGLKIIWTKEAPDAEKQEAARTD